METAQCVKAEKPLLDCRLTQTKLLHSSAECLFNIYRNEPYLFPDLMPDQIRSIELLAGAWNQKGSIRRWTFVDGKTWHDIVEDINDQVMSIKWALLEGDLLHKHHSILEVVHQFSVHGNGCKATVTLFYVKKDIMVPDNYMKFFIQMLLAADKGATAEQ